MPVLLNLLHQAQTRCREDSNVVVVHAFADPTYNRTSFHLAAKSAQSLVSVTSELAITALNEFQHQRILEETERRTDFFHPHVGVVDHISVMSLCDSGESDTSMVISEMTQSAHQIGQAMEETGQLVHYYGHAHPQKHPLAQVRREKTPFFHQHQHHHHRTSDPNTRYAQSGICLVGVPFQFVENYNVRVQCTSKSLVSRTLTQRLRERDGGIVGVEALTLPYGEGCWEVAMNLLAPNLVPQIETVVNEWKEGTVLQSYRVGSTVEQCRRCIFLQDRQSHDASLMKQLNMDLKS